MNDQHTEEVILVDEFDRPIGFQGKLEAHRDGGKLHRAFSIFIFNGQGEMLLQRRSTGKYHFGGLWSNACCSHPRRGETLRDAVHRRLQEELGFDTELREVFSFTYTATDPRSGLTEREYDHVFIGEFDGVPRPHRDEVDDVRWLDPKEAQRDMGANPEKYAPWFRIAFPKVTEIH